MVPQFVTVWFFLLTWVVTSVAVLVLVLMQAVTILDLGLVWPAALLTGAVLVSTVVAMAGALRSATVRRDEEM